MASADAPVPASSEAQEVLAEQRIAAAGEQQAMSNYSQKLIEQKERELMECIAKNYGRIREVEKELVNLQFQLKLTSGPKKHALELMRRKIEEQNERVVAVRKQHATAKTTYERLDAQLRQEEAAKERLCDELNTLVQQAATAQLGKLEELKTHLEGLYSPQAPAVAAAPPAPPGAPEGAAAAAANGVAQGQQQHPAAAGAGHAGGPSDNPFRGSGPAANGAASSSSASDNPFLAGAGTAPSQHQQQLEEEQRQLQLRQAAEAAELERQRQEAAAARSRHVTINPAAGGGGPSASGPRKPTRSSTAGAAAGGSPGAGEGAGSRPRTVQQQQPQQQQPPPGPAPAAGNGRFSGFDT